MKGAIDLESLTPTQFTSYCALCGAVLARGHAQSRDAVVVSAYLGRSRRSDEAFTTWAHKYADQVERHCQACRVGSADAIQPAVTGAGLIDLLERLPMEHLGDLIDFHGFDAIAEVVEGLERENAGRLNRSYYNVGLGNEDGQRRFFVHGDADVVNAFDHALRRHTILPEHLAQFARNLADRSLMLHTTQDWRQQIVFALCRVVQITQA